MEEELARLWEGISLTDQKRKAVVIDSSVLDKTTRSGRCCLLAMIIAEKVVNREAFKKPCQEYGGLKVGCIS